MSVPVIESLRNKALWMADGEHRDDLRSAIECFDARTKELEAMGDHANALEQRIYLAARAKEDVAK